MTATTSQTNREIEHGYFEQFRNLYELPPGCVCYEDKPDVLVKGPRTVGIEITNFYSQSGTNEGSEQRQRPRRYEVLSNAHRQYLAARGKGIELTVEFEFSCPITSARKRILAQELAAFAASVDSRPSGAFYPNSFPGMPEIKSIWLSNKDWDSPKWVRPRQVFSYEEMSAGRLKEIILDKESKAANYAPCDAFWLLVIVDWKDAAQDQEITTSGLKIPSNVFEKIVIYKPGFEEIAVVHP